MTVTTGNILLCSSSSNLAFSNSSCFKCLDKLGEGSISIERIIYAPQATQTLWGISFSHDIRINGSQASQGRIDGRKAHMDKKKNKYDVDIPKEVLDAFARYIIPEIRRFHESEERQAFYKEWLEKHPEYAEK